MCFSAPASFTAAAGLAVIGVIAIRQAKTKPQYLLAVIPLIFAVQQLAEGFLWLSLSNPRYLHLQNYAMYTFLAFAQVVWPAYVPFVIFMFEKDPKRKKAIGYLAVLGVFTAAYLLFCLLRYPVVAGVDDHHINYELNFPFANWWNTGIAYMLATVGAPLLSQTKRLVYLGLLLLLSYVISTVLYNDYLISVWCYFAAVLSAYILYFVWRENRRAIK